MECINPAFQTVFQSPGSTPARSLAPLPSMSNRSRSRSTNWIFSLVEQWHFTQSVMAIKLSYRRADAQHWSEIPNRSGGRKGHVVLPINGDGRPTSIPILFVSTSAKPLDLARVIIERRNVDPENEDALERAAERQQLAHLQHSTRSCNRS